MNITSINTIKLKVPLNKPMRTRYVNLEHIYCMLLMLKTDTGLVGQGLVRAVNQPAITIIENFINHFFSSQLIGENFNSPEQLWNSLWLHKRNHLQSSFGLYALAAIDIAIWDITAQQENKSLHQLLGITKDFVVPYGNGGWLANTQQEFVNEIQWYLSRDCKHFKMRLGSDNDIARIKFLRDTFGENLILIADANQYYDFNSALEMSKHLADFNILWFEEPLFSSSITELAELAELSPVAIATGENMNSHWQIQDACKLKAAKILQPDVIYQGGITEFKRSAEIIDSANLTLGAHLFHELSISLAGLCKKHYVEHIDFFPANFFINDFSIKDGKIFLPKTPGHGVTISKQAIQQFSYKDYN
jgi:L-alanine-DL-glutamate epimerase-like enolase superfamily enzyme